VSIDDLPALQAWVERIRARPAVQRGIVIPEPVDFGSSAAQVKTVAQSMLVTAPKPG